MVLDNKRNLVMTKLLSLVVSLVSVLYVCFPPSVSLITSSYVLVYVFLVLSHAIFICNQIVYIFVVIYSYMLLLVQEV